jgi:hypothetical protein
MTTSFIAVYRGESVSAARLIAVSADPSLVADVSSRMLRDDAADEEADPVVAPIDRARRRALRLVHKEASGGRGA